MAANGHDKALAGMANSVGLRLKDAGDHVRNLSEMMEDLFAVFDKNRGAAGEALAQGFFGRGGKAMLPMLRLPDEERREFLATFAAIKASITGEQLTAMARYKPGFPR